ncbi:MAG: hypothetical protein GQ527_12045 [Bacteroidales bacterium]|nr:hypothetical protein [Bacteroidales bacterium]
MRTISKFQRLALVIVFTMLVIPFNSCEKDDDNDDNDDIETEETTISGKWEFVISPNESYQDTTTILGVAATDYEENSSSYSEVFLYEDENQEIYGESWGYKINGKRTGNIVALNFYTFPEGPLDESTMIENMELFTQMELTVNEFGIMVGDGSYIEDPDQEWTKIDTYFIEALKLNDITNPNLKSSFKHILCDIASTFTSYLISVLTDGIFRPMASCYGHKDGGGFYAFGHEGPGSSFPIYTQTVYVAWEWSWCKVRSYSFHINLKGETIGYEALKAEVHQMEPVLKTLDKLGFSSFDVFEDLLDDFYDKFGGFAISTAYSTHSHNLSLYVNHEKGSSHDAEHHPLIEMIKGGLDPFCHHVAVYAGKDIHDHFHLRRSDIGVCNSDIIIFYLFGTHHVNYD